MPLSFVRQDITKLEVDAIVNAANTQLRGGGGVCGAIFDAAGYRRMTMACRRIGHVNTGEAVVTPGFRLPARYVIHAAGPVWHGGGRGERILLEGCYRNSLELATSLGCRSIAFPLISAGIYGYPRAEAFAVAVSTIRSHLIDDPDLEVVLCLFDREATTLADDLYGEVAHYIDDRYVDDSPYRDQPTAVLDESFDPMAQNLPRPGSGGFRATRTAAQAAAQASHPVVDASTAQAAPQSPYAADAQREAPPRSASSRTRRRPLLDRPARSASSTVAYSEVRPDLEDLLLHLDSSFADTLLEMIDLRGMTDAEVYGRANLSRQYFSKLRSGAVNPSKRVVCALAVALSLDLDDTRLLLERAGHALTHASRFDIIVEWFISAGSYDVYEINQALFRFDQPLLGTS